MPIEGYSYLTRRFPLGLRGQGALPQQPQSHSRPQVHHRLQKKGLDREITRLDICEVRVGPYFEDNYLYATERIQGRRVAEEGYREREGSTTEEYLRHLHAYIVPLLIALHV